MVAGAGLSLSQENGAPHATEDGRSGRHLSGPAVALLLLVLVTSGGTVGYVVVEGWSWWDAFYMTVITVTTVGYREVHPLSRAGRGLHGRCCSSRASARPSTPSRWSRRSSSRAGWQRQFRRRRIDRMIDELDGHFILCGFGRIGSVIADEFRQQDIPFVVVERDPERVQEALDARHARRRGRRQPRRGAASGCTSTARAAWSRPSAPTPRTSTRPDGARAGAGALHRRARRDRGRRAQAAARRRRPRRLAVSPSARSRWRRRRCGRPSSTS